MVEATALAQVYPQMIQNSYLTKASADRGPFGMLTPSYGLQGNGTAVTSYQNNNPAVTFGNGTGAKQLPTNFVSNNSPAYQGSMLANQQTVNQQLAARQVAVPAEIAAQAALGAALLLACLMNWPLIA